MGYQWMVAVLVAGAGTPGSAQTLRPPGSALARRNADSTLGFDIDTTTRAHEWTSATSRTAAGSIYRNWAAYLKERQSGAKNIRSPYWRVSEQLASPWFDLAPTWINQEHRPRVLSILPTTSRRDEYLVETVWTIPTGTWGAIERVYAVRDGMKWVFSGALAHNTRGWNRTTVGPITYVYPPAHIFDSVRARRAVAFADSVAVAFGLQPLPNLNYYLAASADDAIRLMGIENYQKYPGDGGGFSRPGSVFAGDPRLGEEYRHELVHHLFAPLSTSGGTDGLVTEGIAVWLGGTKGMDFATARRAYGAFLREHPEETLDSAVGSWDRNHGTAGAVLLEMVYAKGGASAIKSLFGAGFMTGTGKPALERILGMSWDQLGRAWRVNASMPP